MSKDMAVVILGVWITILPYLGIPNSWRTAILLCSGLAVAALGFAMRRDALRRGSKRDMHHPFVESGVPHEPHQDTAYERKEGIHSLN